MKPKNGFVISTTLYSIFGIMLLTVFYILYLLSNNRYVLTSSIDEVKSGLEKSDKKIYIKIVYDDGVNVDFEEIRKKLQEETNADINLVVDNLNIEVTKTTFYDENTYPLLCKEKACSFSAGQYKGLYQTNDNVYFFFSTNNTYTSSNTDESNDNIGIVVLSAENGTAYSATKNLNLANYYYYQGTNKYNYSISTHNDSAVVNSFYNYNNKIIFKVTLDQSYLGSIFGDSLDNTGIYNSLNGGVYVYTGGCSAAWVEGLGACNGINQQYPTQDVTEYYSIDLENIGSSTNWIKSTTVVPTTIINALDYLPKKENYRCATSPGDLSGCKEKLGLDDENLSLLSNKLSYICNNTVAGSTMLQAKGCDVTVVGDSKKYILLTSNLTNNNEFYETDLDQLRSTRWYTTIKLYDNGEVKKTQEMYLNENSSVEGYDEKYYFIFSNSLNDGDNINIEDNFSESLSGFKGYIVSNNAMVTIDTDTTPKTMNWVINNIADDVIVGVDQFINDKASNTTYIKDYILNQIK